MNLTPCGTCLIPKVEMIIKGKCLELIQDIQAARNGQLKTFRKEDSRAAAVSGKDHGIRVFKVRVLWRD